MSKLKLRCNIGGICHSDLSKVDDEWGFNQYPIVPGYQVVGTTSAIGKRISYLKVGNVVGLGWHSGYCMNCPSCFSGDHRLCASAQATISGHYGVLAEKVLAKTPRLVKLPASMDAENTGPLFCGGITVFNPIVQFNIRPTERVGVIGFGGLGHLALEFLNAWDWADTAFTSSERKKAEALKMDAHHTINSRESSAIEVASGQFDFIISTVNVKFYWNIYLNSLGSSGRLHFVGAVLEPLDVGAFPLIMGQQTISGSPVGSPGIIARMLAFAVLHTIKAVIEKYSFDMLNDAVEK